MIGSSRFSRRTALSMAGAAAVGVGCSAGRASPAEGSATPSPPMATPTSGPVATTTSAAPIDEGYEPPAAGEWEQVSPAEAGFAEAGLADLLTLVGDSKSQSFMLLWDGRIVAEQYWLGADVASVKDVASVQKVVVSTLLGIARDHALIDFGDHVSDVLGDGWSNAAVSDERLITVAHLLTMSSGLDPRTLRRSAPPGTVWDYNTDAYQKLRRVLETIAATDINTLSKEWLFDSLGFMAEPPWRVRPGAPDPAGDERWGLAISARDLARFGLFALRNGRWAGDQIVDDGWFAEAWTPTALKGNYGYLWWLLGKGPLGQRGAPVDLVAGLGAADQKLYVLPSSKLVVVRQGQAVQEVVEAGSDFDAVLLAAIRAARA